MPAILLNTTDQNFKGKSEPLSLFDDSLKIITANEDFMKILGMDKSGDITLLDALARINPDYLDFWKSEYEAFKSKASKSVFHIYEREEVSCFFRMNWLMDSTGEEIVELRLIEPNQGNLSLEEERIDGISSLSHEVNTPLNGILGVASLITDEFPEHSELQGYARILRSKGKEIRTTTNALIDLYKDLGKGEISLRESVNLESLLKEVLHEYEDLIHEYRLELHVDLDHTSTTLVTKAIFLNKTIDNILNYIVKYSGASILHIGSERKGKEYRILLTASGESLHFSTIVKLFKEAKRANADISDLQNAAVMNLSLAKRFLRMINGYLDVSYTKGIQLCFLITLNLD